ncbi:lysylphosphatidylglycerol synthase transmembrane domain-containing protein [Aureimonas frigidaquae]|uniref:lysylphosphatidylglycerol synthase transmembrane domain-containing protein n=1 Tax=Aureimonas frigidaquae TaxID=424757 RepID=UPI000785916F|nr:YbhN family protein [Aureimonas frigidaquae]
MRLKEYIWPVIGLGAVLFSGWLLYHEVRGLSLDDILTSFQAISGVQWALASGAAIAAYGLLALYDQLALRHLNKNISFPFVLATSFTTYALSHNIGASVFSGAVVRYRAYTSKGLSVSNVALLIAFCSFTFALGVVIVTAVSLLLYPEAIRGYYDVGTTLPRVVAGIMLGLVALYVIGSIAGFRPLRIRSFELRYPARDVVLRQLIIAPSEIVAAAAIIYFALPPEHHPGFMMVVAIFVISFSLALLSHAPGGLGVLEVAFLAGLKGMAETDVLAALLAFRILYLLIPFAIAIVIVLGFEQRSMWKRRRAPAQTVPQPLPPKPEA